MTARHRVRFAAGSALVVLLVLAADGAAQPAPAELPEGAVARIGRPRIRLPGAVINVAFAPKGTTFVSTGMPAPGSTSPARLLVQWDAATGKPVREFGGHKGGVEAVSFSGDGSKLASGGRDFTVRIWDAATGNELRACPGHTATILAVAFSPDGKRIASESQDATLRIWDADTGKQVKLLPGHKSNGTSNVRYSPDGKLLASVGADFAVRLRNSDNGAEVHKLPGPTKDSESLDFTPDSKRVAALSEEGKLWVWDTATGRELLQFQAHPAKGICVRYSPDGKTLATGGDEGTLKFWDAASGKLLRSAMAHARSVSELSFSADGTMVATAGHEGTVRLWDAATARELPQSGGGVGCFALSPDGARIATQGTEPLVRFWTPATGAELLPAAALDRPAAALAFTADGKSIATADSADDLQLWDVASGKPRGVHGQRAALPLARLAASPHGRLLATLGRTTLRLWDANGEVRTPGADRLRAEAVRFLPAQAVLVVPGDTHVALAGRDGRVRLWDASTGQETTPNATAPLDGSVVTALACSPDGRTIADGGTGPTGRVVRIWEAVTGTGRRWVLPVPSLIRTLAFSPDRRLLAAGGDGGFLIVWDLWNRTEVVRRTAHAGGVTDLAFTPDGRFLVTAGGEIALPSLGTLDGVLCGDGTALVWDVAALVKKLPPIPRATNDDRDALWADLGGANPVKADAALWKLSAAPDVAVPLLEEKLPRAAAGGGGDVAKLLVQLDDDDFDVREKATQELIRRGPAVAAAVKRELAVSKSPEVRRRAQTVLDKLGAPGGIPADELLVVRGVEVLQRIDSPESRRLLETWAKGPADAALGREARIAVLRMPAR